MVSLLLQQVILEMNGLLRCGSIPIPLQHTQEANKHQVLFDGRSNASGGADNPVILLRADGTIRMGSGNQGASIIHTTYPLESSTGAVSFDSWHHLAVTKQQEQVQTISVFLLMVQKLVEV